MTEELRTVGRRATDGVDLEWRKSVDESLRTGAARMGEMESAIKENTEGIKAINTSTGELVEFFSSMKGAFKVFNFVGMAARPLASILALCAAGWALVKGVPWPPHK